MVPSFRTDENIKLLVVCSPDNIHMNLPMAYYHPYQFIGFSVLRTMMPSDTFINTKTFHIFIGADGKYSLLIYII